MTTEQLAVTLYEALQDKKKCVVEVQPIRYIDKDSKKYYLRIDDKRYPVSRKIAINAIEWKVPVTTPEILEKNGFETHQSGLRMFFEHDDYRLCYYLNSSNRFTSFNNIDGSLVQKVIVNVHQLQHALKLCGIDKEIVV